MLQVELREDSDPDLDFYYDQQFKVYHEPYLIWERDIWETVLSACSAYLIEAEGNHAGDVILENRGGRGTYIVDLSVLPEYQGKGVGKAVLKRIKGMAKRVTAVTRKETLHFFLKSGFVLQRTMKSYYDPGIDGYYIVFSRKESVS